MSAQIIPIKGEHQSAKSLLAEVMSDDTVTSIVGYAFDDQGNCRPFCFGIGIDQISMVSVHAAKWAMEAMDEEID